METAGLLLVGAVLFVNGVVFLRHAEPRNAAVINIFVGLVQTVIPFHLLVTAHGSDDLLEATPLFLFGLTYLWTGITNLTRNDGTALGWFCIWVAAITVVFSAVALFHFNDPKQAVIWLNWGVLWGLFWSVLACGRTGHRLATGGAAIVMSVWTCTVPAILTMIGLWDDLPVWPVIVATAITPFAIRALSKCAASLTQKPQVATQPLQARHYL
ncbi:AmiS/UreI family transporter [Arthrobacter sp. AB6]|uniref:AmiS/UreI family transporter n=1 Tax=Arthrobacter sp. AB6 TaxID=2962570 RepID=UPI002882A77D|nr:AmiS/UreI family transporter [Arthrobacter sp. AB6]MDT0196518.1 AmiS/UreI family transporter [Arthrobacter sp. AB6]